MCSFTRTFDVFRLEFRFARRRVKLICVLYITLINYRVPIKSENSKIEAVKIYRNIKLSINQNLCISLDL